MRMKRSHQHQRHERPHTCRFVLKSSGSPFPKALDGWLCNISHPQFHGMSEKWGIWKVHKFCTLMKNFETKTYLQIEEIGFEIRWILNVGQNQRVEIHGLLVAPKRKDITSFWRLSFVFVPFFSLGLLFLLPLLIRRCCSINCCVISIVICHLSTTELSISLNFRHGRFPRPSKCKLQKVSNLTKWKTTGCWIKKLSQSHFS